MVGDYRIMGGKNSVLFSVFFFSNGFSLWSFLYPLVCTNGFYGVMNFEPFFVGSKLLSDFLLNSTWLY